MKKRQRLSRRKEAQEREPAAASEPVEDAGVPAVAGRQAFILGLVVGVLSFLVYLRTLAPALHFGDGIEFATAAYVLGVPHPTGYPLYMILLKLWMLVPIGEVITRTSLFSALCGAGAAGVSAGILCSAIESALPAWTKKSQVLAAGCGGLLLALLRFTWENSTVTEVYALQLLLTVCFLRAVQVFGVSRKPGALVAAAACLGLGLAHHRLSVTFVLPLLVAWVAARRFMESGPFRRTAVVSVALVLLLLGFYLYLPIRAASSPEINWGNPGTFSSFLHHVRGGDYMQFQFMQARPGIPFTVDTYMRFAGLAAMQLAGDLAAQVTGMRPIPVESPFNRPFFAPSGGGVAMCGLILAFAWAGTIVWARSQRLAFAAALLMALANLAVIMVYNIADIRDYCLFPFWLAFGCAYLGLLRGADLLRRRVGVVAGAPAETAYVLTAIPALVLWGNFAQCDRSGDSAAEMYSAMILPGKQEVMPEGSILLTGGDQDAYTSWYRQIVRGERRDVFVFGSNFIYKSWYPGFFSKEQLDRYAPRFAAGVARSSDEFVQQIADGVVEPNIGRYPVFTSIEDPLVLQGLAGRYDLRLVGQQRLYRPEFMMETTATLLRVLPKGQQEAEP